MDFNPTYFSHPKAADGLTLAHPDNGIRKFWIEHGIACRKIGAEIGAALGKPCVTNVWIPDGMKDVPVDRVAPAAALDRGARRDLRRRSIGPTTSMPWRASSSASARRATSSARTSFIWATPSRGRSCSASTRAISIRRKRSSTRFPPCSRYLDEILLHVSRGMRWDSDHVVILDDELLAIAQELVRGNFLERTHIGLDYFDAWINRVAAWVIGARAMLKALLIALLEPIGSCSANWRRRAITPRGWRCWKS